MTHFCEGQDMLDPGPEGECSWCGGANAPAVEGSTIDQIGASRSYRAPRRHSGADER